MRALPLLVLLLAPELWAQIVPRPGPSDTARVKFDPDADASAETDRAVAIARRDGKHILLDVGGEWCSWCHKLDAMFREQPDITRFLHDHYVVVKVNVSRENRNREVLSRYLEIPGYPHFFVLNEHGELLRSQDTGALERGDRHDPVEVLRFLKAWAPGAVGSGSP